MTIPFVYQKSVYEPAVYSLLKLSEGHNHWSNNGPVVQLLESSIRKRLYINASKSVIATANGTCALFAVIEALKFKDGTKDWIVPAFTFTCGNQGPLSNATVVDVKRSGDLRSISEQELDLIDGIVVTNLFGWSSDLDCYKSYSEEYGKHIVYDSAASFGTRSIDQASYLGNFGTAEIFSFHHTKPMGFGEGGCIIIDKRYEDICRAIINFGKGYGYLPNAFNGKMSDVSAAYILSWWEIFDKHKMSRQHLHQFWRIVGIAESLGICELANYRTWVNQQDIAIPNAVALLFKKPIPQVKLHNQYVQLQKYYKPIESKSMANHIYDYIVNFPCHPGVIALSDDEIYHILEGLLND